MGNGLFGVCVVGGRLLAVCCWMFDELIRPPPCPLPRERGEAGFSGSMFDVQGSRLLGVQGSRLAPLLRFFPPFAVTRPTDFSLPIRASSSRAYKFEWSKHPGARADPAPCGYPFHPPTSGSRRNVSTCGVLPVCSTRLWRRTA